MTRPTVILPPYLLATPATPYMIQRFKNYLSSHWVTMLLIIVSLPFAVVVFAPMLVPVLLVGVYNAYYRMIREDFEEVVAPKRSVVTTTEGASFPLGFWERARMLVPCRAIAHLQLLTFLRPCS